LVKRGFVKSDAAEGILLQRWEEPLKEWADLYDWRRNKLYHYYCHARDSEDVMNTLSAITLDDQRSAALGFQAGASLVSPHATFNQVHLIIDAARFDAIHADIQLQLRLEPSREGANLVIVRPYHRHSALFGSRQIRKWRVVSDIQLYLDLHRYPLRGEEQASHLWDMVIRPRLEDAFKNARTKTRG
jgi:Transcriptional regulator, AbiEi antitoxin, Type IV TA system